MTSKAELRLWAKDRRRTLPDVSGIVTAHLAAWLAARGMRRVLAYRALAGEVSVDGLAPEFELFTTRAAWRSRRLTVHRWDSATVRSSFGMLEPPQGAPQVPLEDIQAVLVPGLAFDGRGARLGYGGGFYDRFLPSLNVPLVGVIPSALVLAELPSEAHDVRVDVLATEEGVTAAGEK